MVNAGSLPEGAIEEMRRIYEGPGPLGGVPDPAIALDSPNELTPRVTSQRDGVRLNIPPGLWWAS